MAHVQKIKASAVAPMVAHYERTAELERGYVRGNIDPTRTALNYNLRPHDGAAAVKAAMEQHERTAGRAVRSDANVLCDWVVTLPKDCPTERSREFFEACATFLEQRYGKENVVGAYVHMDETTPHIHVPVVPLLDKKLQASKMVNRRDLQTFHKDLGAAVDKALGIHVSIELDEEQKGEKQLSKLAQKDYIAAKQALEEQQQRLESLRREVEQLEPTAQTVSESARTLITARSDGSREEALGSEIEGLRERVSELEGANRAAGERVAELDRSLPALRERCASLGERFEAINQRVTAVIERLREVPNTVSAWSQTIARVLGKRVADSTPKAADLDEVGREHVDASRVYNSQREPISTKAWSKEK